MIHLDEYHSVSSAEEVAAISPMYIPAPVPVGQYLSDRPSIIDPERCQVHLKSGRTFVVERGVAAVREALHTKERSGE